MDYILRDSAASLTQTLLQIHRSGVYNSPELSARLLLDLAQKHKTTTDRKADRLTEREREVVSLVRQGCQNREIASRLELQESTIKHHLRSAFAKLKVHSRAELAALV